MNESVQSDGANSAAERPFDHHLSHFRCAGVGMGMGVGVGVGVRVCVCVCVCVCVLGCVSFATQ